MKVSKLNEKAVHETLRAIFTNADNLDADSQKVFLDELVSQVMNPLANEDFFGTEGWEHWAGVDD